MSDFAAMMELAHKYGGTLDQLVELAQEIAPEVVKAEPAIASIVKLLIQHKASKPA